MRDELGPGVPNTRPHSILTLSALWPNSAQPAHGVFVESRLRAVREAGGARYRVVSPTPSLPFRASPHDLPAPERHVPPLEKRALIVVHHPRYPRPPQIASGLHAEAMYYGVRGFVRRLLARRGPVDLLDAQRAYPEGVVAHWLARDLDLPFVITVRETDLAEVEANARHRRHVAEAFRAARAVAVVSEGLQPRVRALGAPSERVAVVRDGVDLDLFSPLSDEDRSAYRTRLGVPDDAALVVSAGPLLAPMRHEATIAAIASLPDIHLRIAGAGDQDAALQATIDSYGLRHCAALLGDVPHRELPKLFGAADMTVLASPGDVAAAIALESLACGTPVVAVDENGESAVSEIIGPETPAADGRSKRLPNLDQLSSAIAETAAAARRSDATREIAAGYGWETPVTGVVSMLRAAAPARKRRQTAPVS